MNFENNNTEKMIVENFMGQILEDFFFEVFRLQSLDFKTRLLYLSEWDRLAQPGIISFFLVIKRH